MIGVRIALLASVLAFLPASAQSATQFFTSSSAFAAATTAPKTIGFNGILPAGTSFEGFNVLSVSGVTFRDPMPNMLVNVNTASIYSPAIYPSDFITSDYIAGVTTDALSTLVISFSSPTYAVGLNYGGLGSGGSAQFTLSNGSKYSAAPLPPTGRTIFAGWVSTDPITSVAIDVTNDYWVVESVIVAIPPSVSTSPVFPATVISNITATTANVSASIQPRPQDVGTNSSIFVFAHAPSNLVTGGTSAKHTPASPPGVARPEDAIVCVLAQVNSSGQFVAVSASTMQAYFSGLLGAQSQAVEILNNVSTPNVAGATLYVGYGSSAAAMLTSGVYQAAISVPGPVQCTASLASAPAPESPGALTGLWWNASESGWGIHFTQRGPNLFAAWYTYDASGNPKWYVAPDCVGMTGANGTCTGSLYQVNGPTFFGANFTPITSNQTSVAGSFRASFTDANNGSITYALGTLTRTVSIVRQPIGVGTVAAAVDYTDLWWNPNESGWGMAMAQMNANIFLAWFVYDGTGKPVWYVASNCAVSASSCSGTLYSTTGPPLGPTFDPNQVHIAPVGNVVVSFIDANNAVLSYIVSGVSATKTITRQLF